MPALRLVVAKNEVTFASEALLKPGTKDPKPPEVDMSRKYSVALVLADQLGTKEICVMEFAAEATGSGGTVVSAMVFELDEVPDALVARIR